jgi:hypothetical protein
LLNSDHDWDSINIAEMSPQPDTWVLIDALSQQPQLHLWLKTTDGDLNHAAEAIDVDSILESAIHLFGLKETQHQDDRIERPESGRQMGEETSTLDYLTGLRADPNDRNPISAQNHKSP